MKTRLYLIAFAAVLAFGQQPAGPALPEKNTPLRKSSLLLREGKTDEARVELQRLLKANPNDADIWYQLARAYLLDFYQGLDYQKRRVSLALAMESLSGALKHNPDHIPSLRAKAVIHARAELLYYDPNLSYELAARVSKLEPHANGFLINLSEWLAGEVRFTTESGHRVPHDPLVGLDRSIDLLDRVIDTALPFSNEESAGLFIMANALSRRGNFADSILYYKQALARTQDLDQRMGCLREMGASYYRMGDFTEAARTFYQALQYRMNPVDQWLLKVSMDQMKGGKPDLPRNVLFPAAEPVYDKANPPLLAFKDMAPELGVNRYDGNGTASWGDYDSDGDLDLFEAGSGSFMMVFRNDGAKFTDVTEQVGLAKVPSGYSLNLVDYDNDGRVDLYISLNGWSGPMKNRLYHNAGGRFEDVSAKSGAEDPGSGFSAMWGDLDNDGWLDFVVANGVIKDGSTPQIYRNNHDGTFTNMTLAAGIKEPPSYGAIGIALGDYDKDGRLDILINGLDPAPTRLYHNEGSWKFKEVSRQAGVGHPPHNGFVCLFFDYNNDGWPDILTTALAHWDSAVEALKAGYSRPNARAMHPDVCRLFKNNQDGTFTDVTFETKLLYPMGVMGGGVADLDNDGYVDLYFGTGDPQMSRLEPNHFFRNNGNGTFTDLTSYVGFARPGNKGHGVTFVDIDDDGDLDIYAQLGGHYPGDQAYNAFYRNLKGNQNRWLEVQLAGVKSNRFGVGAQLTLRSGDLLVYREVKSSEGFGSTNPYRQHSGLGQRTKIDSIEIRWPSGIKQIFKDLDSNHILAIREDIDEPKRLK